MSLEDELKTQPIQHAQLTITANGSCLIAGNLGYLALKGRALGHEILTFLYRDPYDPDAPNEPSTCRR